MTAPTPAPGRRTLALDDDPDRVVLVTGAGGGIGRAIVADVLARGWAVLATDVVPSEDYGAVPARVRYVQADVTDHASMVAAARAAEELGALRGCIANAGVVTEDYGAFLQTSPTVWRPTIDVNVLGTLNTFHAAAPIVKAHGGGRMAATASVAGVRAESDIVAYSASKAAVISIVRSLALELGSANVSLNAVAPGPVSGEHQGHVVNERAQAEARAGGYAYSTRYERFRDDNRPFARMATPQEVAGVLGWLLSDAASYVTGQVVVLDGGGVLV